MSVNFVLMVKKFKLSKKIISVIYFLIREVFKFCDRIMGKILVSIWLVFVSYNLLKILFINY